MYNAAGSPINRICEIMEKTSKSKIAKFRAAHGLPMPSTGSIQPNSRVKRQITKTMPERASNSGITNGGQNFSLGNEQQKGNIEKYASDQKNPDEVTVDMKLDFINKVRLLTNEGLTKLVSFVTGNMESAV